MVGRYVRPFSCYSNLVPNCDYSWYNPDKLIGFEDEITIYHQQKASLDEINRKDS